MPPNSTSEANKVSAAGPTHTDVTHPETTQLRELSELRLQDLDVPNELPNSSKNTLVHNADSDDRLRPQDEPEQQQGLDLEELQQDHHHDYEYKFSFRQMYQDTLNLDWSKVKWDMVLCLVPFHVFALWGFYLVVTCQLMWQTAIFMTILAYSAGLGVTMGVHRLWTHKAFNARWPVRFALMICNSIAFQESIYLWSQNHRVHHKWSDTDRDFTNSRRGFFFAHMGWKMYETHPEVIKARKMVDCSDLLEDPFVRIQHNYYYPISLTLAFVVPTLIPYYCWGEDLWTAFLTCGLLRLAITFHTTWCINSVAHLYGYKPYDKTLHAFENTFLGSFALGEGWHNYHHAFPRDYRASEVGGWFSNFTTKLIELLSKVGLTYELKTETDHHINSRTARTGDQAARYALLRKQRN